MYRGIRIWLNPITYYVCQVILRCVNELVLCVAWCKIYHLVFYANFDNAEITTGNTLNFQKIIQFAIYRVPQSEIGGSIFRFGFDQKPTVLSSDI